MNTFTSRNLRLGLKVLFLGIILWAAKRTMAAEQYVPFDGEKTTWHGFDRYDFVMDDATGAILPVKAPEKEVASDGIDATLKDGKRRCVVIVPKGRRKINFTDWAQWCSSILVVPCQV